MIYSIKYLSIAIFEYDGKISICAHNHEYSVRYNTIEKVYNYTSICIVVDIILINSEGNENILPFLDLSPIT